MYLALQRGSWELITSGLSVGPEWKSVPGARLDYRLAGLQLLWERVVLGSSIVKVHAPGYEESGGASIV